MSSSCHCVALLFALLRVHTLALNVATSAALDSVGKSMANELSILRDDIWDGFTELLQEVQSVGNVTEEDVKRRVQKIAAPLKVRFKEIQANSKAVIEPESLLDMSSKTMLGGERNPNLCALGTPVVMLGASTICGFLFGWGGPDPLLMVGCNWSLLVPFFSTCVSAVR